MLLWCGAVWRESLSSCSWAARAHRLAPALNTDSQRRCKRAGVHRLTVHGARRTCATLLVDLDVHPRHVDQAVTAEIDAEASSGQAGARRCSESG
jgi:integrase